MSIETQDNPGMNDTGHQFDNPPTIGATAESPSNVMQHDLADPLPISPNGLYPQGAERRDHLKRLLTAHHGIVVGETYDPSTIAIIPIHEDPDRLRTIEVALLSIRNQIYEHPIRVAVGVNAPDQSFGNKIKDIAEEIGVATDIIHAPTSTSDEQNAAFARNRILQTLAERAKEDSDLRAGSFFLVDSDTAASPHSLEFLIDTMRQTGAMAVTSTSIPVDYLSEQTYVEYFNEHPIPTGDIRRLPKLFSRRRGLVKIAALVVHSGEIATKTCGLLLNGDVMRELTEREPNVFLRMPRGSFEDMTLSLTLGQIGDIYHDPRAVLLDQAREDPAAVRRQRRNWGMDHAIVFNDLAQMGYLKPGLHILESERDRWIEWIVPGTLDMTGAIINPNQLKIIRDQLVSMLQQEGFEAFKTKANFEMDEAQLIIGLQLIDLLLQHIDATRGSGSAQTSRKTKSSEFPRPTERNQTVPRWGPDSRVGQFLGNLDGMWSIQTLTADMLPRVFFAGVRQ